MIQSLKKQKIITLISSLITVIITYIVVKINGFPAERFNISDTGLPKAFLESGLVLHVLLLTVVTFIYIKSRWSTTSRDTYNKVLTICITFVITILASVFLKRVSVYAMPIIITPMVLSVLVDSVTGGFMSVIATLTMLPGAIDRPEFIFISLLMGIIASIEASKVTQRSTFPLLGVTLSLYNIFQVLIYSFMTGFEITSFLINSGIIVAMVFGSVIIAFGLMPFLESMTGILSPFKLMDLSNLSQKLIKRLISEAPGTYYHSIMVGNLAEAAAEEVGANPLLARVAAYYHDVGKLKAPQYFGENQYGDNPHDNIDPYDSARIIINHVNDGCKIAEKYGLPSQVIDIIRQHHGNTLVAFFYHRAVSNADENTKVDITKFRYPDQRPVSKEAAIIMLADSVEAAIRSMKDKSRDKVEQTIRKIIKDKLADGQLDLCELTLNDITKIEKALFVALEAYYHKREEYPDVKKLESKGKQNV